MSVLPLLELGDAAGAVKWRPNVYCKVTAAGDAMVVTNGVKATRLSAAEIPVYEALRERATVRIRELPSDPNSNLRVVMRLSALGLLEPVDIVDE